MSALDIWTKTGVLRCRYGGSKQPQAGEEEWENPRQSEQLCLTKTERSATARLRAFQASFRVIITRNITVSQPDV
jgi:hypothetical protein